MSSIIPFNESSNLPSFLRKAEGAVKGNLAAIAEAMSGFPSISIKGKVFHIKRGDEKTLITKPDAPDEPAASIEVVVLAIGPAGANYAKTFYATGYSEGSDAKPTCYSDDGITPAADAEEAQCSKCSICPHNQFGSRISESGAKGKACADTKRLAVAQAGALNDPMLLRVPAASLKPFREFAKVLSTRGITESQCVVTKIGFDYSVAHPALTFKPVGFVDEQTYIAATKEAQSDTVKQIIGDKSSAPALPAPADEEEFEQAAPAPKPAAKPKAEPKPAPKPAPKAEDDDLPAAPKAKVKVEGDVKPKPVVEEADTDIDAAIGDLDFDD